MKKLCAVFLSVTLFLCLSACGDWEPAASATLSEQYKPSHVLQLKLGRVEEGQLWLTCGEPELEGVYRFSYSPDLVEDGAELLPGMLLNVGYDGAVMETHPAQLEPLSIAVAGQEDDFIGLYLEAPETLYAEDPGLNSDTQYFGFDFTEVQNLDRQEKDLLGMLFAADHEKEPLFGTLDELAEQGYVDLENLYWEDGLLFTLSDEPVTKDSFSFSVEKWRSGLGAYRRPDCRASRGESGWTFDPGSTVEVS